VLRVRQPRRPRRRREAESGRRGEGGRVERRGEAEAKPPGEAEGREGRAAEKPSRRRTRKKKAEDASGTEGSIPAACASASFTSGSRTGTRVTKEFPQYLIEDVKIREHITGKLGHAGSATFSSRRTSSGSPSTSSRPGPAS
jgi:hypothetical protein